jgi:hypothetical protein
MSEAPHLISGNKADPMLTAAGDTPALDTVLDGQLAGLIRRGQTSSRTSDTRDRAMGLSGVTDFIRISIKKADPVLTALWDTPTLDAVLDGYKAGLFLRGQTYRPTSDTRDRAMGLSGVADGRKRRGRGRRLGRQLGPRLRPRRLRGPRLLSLPRTNPEIRPLAVGT